jgi:hypothetical protein
VQQKHWQIHLYPRFLIADQCQKNKETHAAACHTESFCKRLDEGVASDYKVSSSNLVKICAGVFRMTGSSVAMHYWLLLDMMPPHFPAYELLLKYDQVCLLRSDGYFHKKWNIPDEFGSRSSWSSSFKSKRDVVEFCTQSSISICLGTSDT